MEKKNSVELQNLRKKRGIQVLPSHDHAYSGVPDCEEERDDRKEKPWQRVIYEIGRKGTHLYEPVKSPSSPNLDYRRKRPTVLPLIILHLFTKRRFQVPSSVLVLVLGVYLLLAYLTQLVEDDLLAVVKDSDVAVDNFNMFSEEAALGYLDQIVGNEPRVCGTPYHLQKTLELKSLVDREVAGARLPVHTDLQTVSDDFLLNQVPSHVMFYRNVSNVIAVLEGRSGFNGNETSTSLLLNCHYDSVPYALGASDNAVFCAIMLETLRRLSRRPDRFKHNIIFLFNGAEENGLQGSHGFLHHPWSKGVTSVVNLDSAGINGKAALFQVTDPRLVRSFQRTTRKPNAQAFGEMLFTAGVIPSDTDFRIWRDFGNISGVDVAFVKGGHVYHTRYDRPDTLRAGVLQYAGEMILNFVSELAEGDAIEAKVAPSAAVYYDYLNVFLVVYSFSAAYAVDAVIVVIAVASVLYYVWIVGFHWSTSLELALSVLSRAVSVVGGALLASVLLPIMIATTVQLRYLSQPWLVVPAFWIPYLVGAFATSHALDYWRTKKSGLNRSIRCAQAMAATRSILATILLVLVCVPGTATMRYLVSAPLLIMSLGSGVSLTVLRIHKLQGWQHLALEIILSLPSVMLVFSLSLRIDSLLLPVMGRTPLSLPDAYVGALNLGLAAYVGSIVSGVEMLFSRRRLWLVLSGVLATCVVVMLVPWSPYQDDGPAVQRHYWFHTEIVSHNLAGEVTERSTGVLITKHDANTIESTEQMLRDNRINVNSRREFSVDCETHVFCNLPLYRPRFGTSLKDSLFLYTEGPAAFQPTPALSVNRSCVGETCELAFHMTGAPHNMVTLWPRDGVEMTGWSLHAPLAPALVLRSRPVYLVVHSLATYSPLPVEEDFTVTLTVPISLQSQPIIEVSLHAHKIQHPQDYTTEYRNLVEATPKYFNIASFMTIRNNYEF